MPHLRILIVDDEKSQRELVGGALRQQGYAVTEAGSAEEAAKAAEKTFFEVALLDIRMPGRSGLELLSDLKGTNPDLQAIMVSAHADFDKGLEAMKKGAFDFLKKPVDLTQLLATIERASERHWLLAENRYLKEKLEEPYRAEDLVMASPAMRDVLSTVARAADSDATVLVRGESGTGKELVARALHHASRRASKSFVAVNCAALPETLLESELFGSEKGAYTGAVARRIGRFELASGGTLFLDEIGDVPGSIQAKLLRVLEHKTFERLGGAETIKSDCRVVVATHQNLEAMVAEGRFREDLYYRLNVIQLVIPPLRERPMDILPLIETFIARQNVGRSRPVKGITPAAKDALMSYGWPGNVRELLNAVERACVLARGDVLDASDFPLQIRRGSSEATATSDSPTLPLAEVERRHIQRALEHHQWSLIQTAATLGIHRNTLRLKMREYGLEKQQ
ncbi:MAG: sigma-54-dependent Fis family transcriptional regulator [candidate division Zixibacteria bacterium]|nr:sigma-54-dependent Fis family transcriptional regulator [candidate division Zixibacteria bacterium]